MGTHYNAFISYKHEPLDTKIAKEVQQSLERYRIPERLQEKRKIKKIERVFRDTEELSLTKNLSETITEALDNTDYLIVICSKKTKESEWVLREISYFMENHPRDHIFTVLVDGEPDEVVPEILQYEDGQKVEPLSCDYRMPKKLASKIELPRLVSAIIGCSYDELMNRQRAYYIRHLFRVIALITILSFLFISQLIYGLHKIHSNYQKALENQSQYLTGEAETFLANEDRVTAIQLILAALPNGAKDSRPLLGRAVRTLAEATNVYGSTDDSKILSDMVYGSDSSITAYDVSKDGRYLAAITIYSTIYVWDTEDRSIVYTKSASDIYSLEVKFLPNDLLLIIGENSLISVDIQTGENIWEVTDENAGFLSEAKQIFDNYLYYVYRNGEIRKYDTDKGELKDTYNVSSDSVIITGFSVSTDSNRIVFVEEDGDIYCLKVYDVSSGEAVTLITSSQVLECATWLDKDTVLVSETEEKYDYMPYMEGYEMVSEMESVIRCYDVPSAKEKWTAAFICNSQILGYGFIPLNDNNEVLFYVGNAYAIYDTGSGEQIDYKNINSPIVNINDNDGDGIPTVITVKGYMGSIEADQSDISLKKCFSDEITGVIVNDGFYVLSGDGRRIIHYMVGFENEYWKRIDIPAHCYITENYIDSEAVVLQVYDESFEEMSLITYDVNNNYKEHIAEKCQYSENIYVKMLGRYGDNFYYVYAYRESEDNEKYELYLRWISIKDGSKGSKMLCRVSGKYMLYDMVGMNQEYISCYGYGADGKLKVILYNIQTDELEEYASPSEEEYVSASVQVWPATKMIYLSTENGDYIVYGNSGESRGVELPDNWDKTSYVKIAGDNRIIACTMSRTILIDRNGKLLNELGKANSGHTVMGALYYEPPKGKKQVIVLYNEKISKYDADTGKLLGECSLRSFSYYPSFYIDRDEKMLYVSCSYSGISKIDMDEWMEVALIENGIGYDPKEKIYYVTRNPDYNNTEIGYIKDYSVDELIEIGKDKLNGAEMTSEQKAKYGLTD